MKNYIKPETANFNIKELDMIAIMDSSLPSQPSEEDVNTNKPMAPKIV